MPRVAVVMPCFNYAHYVGRTVASVQAQTLRDWEMVVVDDGSVDASASVLEPIARHDPRVRLLHQTNQGVTRARNNGATAARESEYMLFLDADDLLDPTMLEVMVGHLERHPDVALACCRLRRIDSDDRPLDDRGEEFFLEGARFVPRGLMLRRLPDENPSAPLDAVMAYHTAIPSACVVRSSAYRRGGGWDTDYVSGGIADKDFVVRMATVGAIHYVPRVLLSYRVHPGGLSRTSQNEMGLLKAKWWRAEHAAPALRVRLRRALAFEEWVTAHLQARGGASRLARGDVWGGGRALLQAANSARRSALMYARARGS